MKKSNCFLVFVCVILINYINYCQDFKRSPTEPNEFHIGWQIGKYAPDSAGIQSAINDAYFARGETTRPVVIFAPGVYNLGSAYIVLMDSISYRFDGIPKFICNSFYGIFTDNHNPINVSFEGSYQIINTTYSGLGVKLSNSLSSIKYVSDAIVRKLVLDLGKFAGMAIDSVRSFENMINEGTSEIVYNTYLEYFTVTRVAPSPYANPNGAALIIDIPNASTHYTFATIRATGEWHDEYDDNFLNFDRIIITSKSPSGISFRTKYDFIPGNINYYNQLPASNEDTGETYMLFIEFYQEGL